MGDIFCDAAGAVRSPRVLGGEVIHSTVKRTLKMDTLNPRFSQLFAQLGLADDPAGIAAFIRAHAPLDPATRLEDAPFWSPSQARLLREELLEDAQWAEVIDQLNVSLRSA